MTAYNSFGGNLPEALELAKLVTLTRALETRLGVRSKVFRAGRYGVGPNTVRLLAGLGYEIEVSSRARFDYAKQGGPSFTRVRPGPFRLAHDMLEVPLSGTYLGRPFPGPEWPRLNAGLVKLRGLRRIGLTPEGVSAADAVEAIRRLLLRGIGPAVMPVSTFNEDIQAGSIAAFPIADANVHRILMLGQPAERKPSAASEEIAHILAAETNRLFDMGLFSLPATGLPQLIMPAPAPRRAARAGARKN